MRMNRVSVEVRRDKIDLLLAAFKAAETAFTTSGNWKAAEEVGKLHSSLREQIFTYERVENE